MHITPSARTEALRLASVTGLDPRTCLKALLLGADSLHPLRMRETLRPYAEAWQALTGTVVATAPAKKEPTETSDLTRTLGEVAS